MKPAPGLIRYAASSSVVGQGFLCTALLSYKPNLKANMIGSVQVPITMEEVEGQR